MTIKQSPERAEAYALSGLEYMDLIYTGRCPVLVILGFTCGENAYAKFSLNKLK